MKPPRFMDPLELSPLPNGHEWTVLADLTYLPAAGPAITVCAGFVTDLASVPRIFWNIFPPFGKYTAAAVLHDWLYTHRAGRPRSRCDSLFMESMKVCGVSWAARSTIYSAVRCWGWLVWNKRTK